MGRCRNQIPCLWSADLARLIGLADQEAQGKVLLQEKKDLFHHELETLIQNVAAAEEVHVAAKEERRC